MPVSKQKTVKNPGVTPPGSSTAILCTPDATATYTASSVTVSPNTLSNVTFTAGTGTASPWLTTTAGTHSTRISLTGEDADIVINGHSLTNTLQALEKRLNILVPNSELEKEWEDLKQLGERYRELEQYIKDKQATFDRLKAITETKSN